MSSTKELAATAIATSLTISILQASTAATTTQSPKASSSQPSSVAVPIETLLISLPPAEIVHTPAPSSSQRPESEVETTKRTQRCQDIRLKRNNKQP
ncbi:hypothetical protein PoB_005152600 [Plakobranchus ocellatus]|uniref:Secreted protein n=1 Tax=Plakobranchus ocellatus TaxID=259542 RepID=A0AAV4C0Y0_9GAST|nr:hypothetical protein PoB_005152600 [Plakobranchus ocellatus]